MPHVPGKQSYASKASAKVIAELKATGQLPVKNRPMVDSADYRDCK